jgi:gamma-glutamyl phosphate reductase
MLDPMVKIINKIKLIFSWQMPEFTILFGIILTLIVLFPKVSIIVVSLCLFFGRTYIITAI